MSIDVPAGPAAAFVPRTESDPSCAGAPSDPSGRLLVAELTALREALKHRTEELEHARARAAHSDLEVRALSAMQLVLEEEKDNLARLHVAATLLHTTLDAGQVVQAVRDVVVNLLGSEEFAVLEFDPENAMLTPLTWMGIDVERLRDLHMGMGPVGRVLRTATPYVRGADPHGYAEADDDILACIPLRLGEMVYGVVVVYSLLPQKQHFAPPDHDLFELLERHAAMALYTTRLHGLLHASQGEE